MSALRDPRASSTPSGRDRSDGPRSIGAIAVELSRAALADAVSTLMPVACAGCGRPDLAICPVCRAAIAAARPVEVSRAGLRVHAGLEYGGVAAALIGAFKDGGRADASRVLAPALAASIRAALSGIPRGSAGARGAGILVATVPSTRAALMARGYRPVPMLLAACGLRAMPVLRLARDRDDQAGLGAAARAANAEGGLVARERLDGRRFLLVDDVLTTGSTLLEARRALVAAGASVEALAVLAETPLRLGRRSGSSR
ncbi:phosphoribosyltransferase family protein [Agromyces sp. PvR057]|uniref:ComF family protein n=1 Tax=Agromyces sp. PvR057 TaxID=3156403 RepID=UPI000E2892C0